MISVGGSFQLVYYLIPKVCKEFYRRHPDIAITIDLGNSHSNEIFYNKLKSHTLDFVFSYVPNCAEFDAIPVICEKFLIAMPQSIAVKNNIMDLSVSKKQILEKSYPKDKEISDFSPFKNISFITYGTNYKQKLLKALLGENLKPSHCRVNNSKNLTLQYRLMCEGIAAVVVPDTHLVLPEFDSDDIVYFVPQSEQSNRTLYFIVNKNRPENHYVDEFIALAKEIMNNLTSY